MSFSIHPNNKANNIYVLGRDFVQGINDTTFYKKFIRLILLQQKKVCITFAL